MMRLRLSPAFAALSASALLVCCSGKSQDLSSVEFTPSVPSAPADGVTAITLTLSVVGADGTTPYNGKVQLACSRSVLFGGQTSPGVSDIVTITNGAGTDTVTCGSGANCVGTDKISGTIVDDSNSSGAGSVFVGFTSTQMTSTGSTTGSSEGTTSGTTGSGASSTGGTKSTTGSGSSTTGGVVDAGPPPPGTVLTSLPTNPYIGIDYKTPNLPNNFPINTFTFEVADVTGKIAVPGQTVIFTADSSNAQGSYLVGGDGGEVAAVSGTDGKVTVQVHSGQKTGPITVVATVAGTSLSAQEESAVVGTQPSMAHSAISCTPVNLPVYTGGHLPCESSSPVNKSTTCIVTLADRFNYAVQVPVAVQFFTEAGNFQSPSVSTPNYGQANPGTITNVLDSTGNLPQDVPPLPAGNGQLEEPSYTDYCSTTMRTYNPRDGLVTVIAVFQGEEQFVSQGGTGVYQPGDPFTDLPQPFVDNDDSSVWKPGDLCPGVSTNSSCGAPNGTWDGNSAMFVQTRIIYTGSATSTTVLPQDSSIQFLNPGPGGLTVAGMQTVNGQVNWADINLNVSEASATYGVTFYSGPMSISVSYPLTGTSAGSPDNLSMIYTPLTICDAGVVPSDAGEVPSTVCWYETAITDFSGGFTGTYSVTSNYTGPEATFQVHAVEHVEADSASNNMSGVAN